MLGAFSPDIGVVPEDEDGIIDLGSEMVAEVGLDIAVLSVCSPLGFVCLVKSSSTIFPFSNLAMLLADCHFYSVPACRSILQICVASIIKVEGQIE